MQIEPPRKVRTLVVDDHPIYRLGLCLALQREPDLEVVGEAANGEEALALVGRLVVEVALVDLHMPSHDGIALTRAVHARYPECCILVISADGEPFMIAQALRAGASGYFSKLQNVDEIAQAIRGVRGGLRYLPPSLSPAQLEEVGPVHGIEALSAREREVLDRLVDGQSNDDIATALFVARRTVETHRQRIMKKLGAHTIADLVHIASRLGVVSL